MNKIHNMRQKNKKDSSIVLTVGELDSLCTSFEAEEQPTYSPIAEAIIEGEINRKQFRQLLLTNINDINKVENFLEVTGGPIHLCVLKREREYLKELLKFSQLDVNLRASEDSTALLLGCELGYNMLVEILMERKEIDINLVDNRYRFALMFALERFDSELVNLLLTRNTKGERNKTLPFITIKEEEESGSIYSCLSQYKDYIYVDEVLSIATLLLTHGAKVEKVLEEFRESKKKSHYDGGPMEEAVMLRNPELLLFFLQNLQTKVSGSDLSHLWNVHLKRMNDCMIKEEETLSKTSEEFIEGNRMSQVLSGYMTIHEAIHHVKIPICTNVVGERQR